MLGGSPAVALIVRDMVGPVELHHYCAELATARTASARVVLGARGGVVAVCVCGV